MCRLAFLCVFASHILETSSQYRPVTSEQMEAWRRYEVEKQVSDREAKHGFMLWDPSRVRPATFAKPIDSCPSTAAAACEHGLDKLIAHLKADGHADYMGGTDYRQFVDVRELLKEQGTKVACETGFNFGASSLAFLCASDDVKVHSFDIGATDYGPSAKAYIDGVFGSQRHSLVLGDSRGSLSDAVRGRGSASGLTCDSAFVDGGHTFEIALADILHFSQLTLRGAQIMVDNCNADGFRRGWGGLGPVNEAYEVAVQNGIVEHRRQISTGCEIGDEDCRETCVGSFKVRYTGSFMMVEE
eukprot:TRINITY_DN57827_c0_g1_i1.p1 TRINITY_DN57827_c0_g1~~TRINITY_DN57827_c0_g1_i1.p1  ORF type:complete len:300 (-),score=36.18 TRINITY_DN57827_c0_g1_i1:131-1030(-)